MSFGPGAQVRYPARLSRARPGGRRTASPPVCSRCLSAACTSRYCGHPAPAREFRPSCDRPTARRPGLPARPRTATGYRVSAHLRLRPGWVPSLPRGPAVLSTGRDCSRQPAACRLSAARSRHPGPAITPIRGSDITRHQRGFTRFTRPAFPSPAAPRLYVGAAQASSPGLRTRTDRTRARTPGRGQARHRPVATSLASARPPRLAHLPRATGVASYQVTLIPLGDGSPPPAQEPAA